VRFDEETRVVGHPSIKLWVEADGDDDMDIFVTLEKLDRHGKHLEVQNSGADKFIVDVLTHFTASMLKYHGAPGRMRMSLRRLDLQLSNDDCPVQSFDTVEKLKPGEIVKADISIYPVGLLMHPGEQLRLVVTGHNIIGPVMPLAGNPRADNHGRHIVHSGGRYDSHLRLPIQRPTE
jgi:uncharacterized protein